jgi:transposase
MDKVDKTTLKNRINTVLPLLNEYQSRQYLSAEARAFGYGGISLVSQIAGVSHETLRKGIQELEDPNAFVPKQGKSRRKGGGRKPIWEDRPGILDVLKEIVAPHTKGDPINMLLWTNQSLRTLSEELRLQGYKASKNAVGTMLKKLGYSLQANKKTLTVTPSHPDRNEQFEYINTKTIAANAQGSPVLSVDAKKKENIGNFKNNGGTYQEKGKPTEVLDHDFPIKELGKATPYGVYNIFRNHGFVNVGISNDTATFAVESIRSWWYCEGITNYAGAKEIVITADCGGSNGYRNRLWKYELQKLANEIVTPIRVLHYPPGTSKWNKIEHRLFSFISKNWKGIPLISTAVVVSLIGATRTSEGLAVTCVFDDSQYEKGIKIEDDVFNSLNIVFDDFHGDWNYTLLPILH